MITLESEGGFGDWERGTVGGRTESVNKRSNIKTYYLYYEML